MKRSLSPREALKNLLDLLPVIERCGLCIPASKGGLFDCHKAVWEKRVREAREALAAAVN